MWISTIQLLKIRPKVPVCNKSDTSVAQFCKQFSSSALVCWTNKQSLWLRIPCDANTFHDCSRLIQFQNISMISFSKCSDLMDDRRTGRSYTTWSSKGFPTVFNGVRKNAPGKKAPRKNAREKIAPRNIAPQENCFTRFLLLLALSYSSLFSNFL